MVTQFNIKDMKYYSIHFNRPDFVRIQNQLANQSGSKLIVINNGSNPDISNICDELSVECHNIDNNNINQNGSYDPNPSVSHGNAINWTIQNLVNFDEDWGLLDHDMFMIQPIDFDRYDADVITMKCDNIPATPYMWPGMLLCRGGVNLSDVDFRPGVGIPADTGSDTWRYVNDRTKWISLSYFGERDNTMIQDSNILTQHCIDDNILGIHYLNGSNWTGGNAIDSKNELLKEHLIKLGLFI